HRFEIATIAAARELRSTYCTAAHSRFLRDICGDGASLEALAEDPSGATLADPDGAVYEFATKVARDASNVTSEDVRRLRAVGLSDGDVADVVFAVAARAFFTKVLDGLGAQLDAPTAKLFDPDLLASMVVGRPVADG
ncbi:MAG: peroxidase, partial [Terracoccus sp.]